jgi:hypothetical protein
MVAGGYAIMQMWMRGYRVREAKLDLQEAMPLSEDTNKIS